MKLTKFHQYIKDENIEADKGEVMAKSFMQDIKNDFCNTYQNLKIDIENSLDMSDIVENAIFFNTDKIRQDAADQITLRVNELINKTQEEIEQFRIDTQIDNEPCDIESFKRDRELNA